MLKNKNTPKKIILIGLAFFLLFATSLLLWKSPWQNDRHPEDQHSNGEHTVLTPTTEVEKQETENHKDNLSNDSKPDTIPNNEGKKQVQPVISYLDRTVINAYVTGIFEEGGTCTATLTNGSQTITKTSTGFQNASYTQCAPIDLSGTNLSGATWSVTISYSSSTSFGNSEVGTIKP